MTSLRRRVSLQAPSPLLATNFRNGPESSDTNDPLLPLPASTPRRSSSFSSKSRSFFSWHTLGITILALILAVVPWLPQRSLYKHVAELELNLQHLQIERDSLIRRVQQVLKKTGKLQEESQQLQQDNSQLVTELHQLGDHLGVVNNYDSTVNGSGSQSSWYADFVTSEDAYLARLEQLHKAIQTKSERNVVDRLGSKGPFRVEVTLKSLMGADADVPQNLSFVIETAPLSQMPHAVDHFLQMVDQKLWDDMQLLHRYVGSHVLHALPMLTEGGDERFEKAQLTQLAFAEHSGAYPIQKYSVVFEGRPGGPAFYINMDDTSAVTKSNEIDVNESCFGQVVGEGRDVLERILRNQGNGRSNVFLMEIESMRMLPFASDS